MAVSDSSRPRIRPPTRHPSTSIAQRVEQIANMVEETTSTIRGTAETAHQLEIIANTLKQQMSKFRI